MSTPLTDAINALTTYANEITGKSDTTLSAAVESLVDGYGGGGGGVDYLDLKTRNAACSEYRNDNITSLGTARMVEGWTNLQKLTLPNLTSISKAYGLGTATSNNLEVDLKAVVSGANQGLQGFNCKTIVFPNWSGALNTYFLYSGNIGIVDLGPGMTELQPNSCTSCRSVLILRRTAGVVKLGNVNALLASVFGSSGTGGTIYVPSALISSYQAANNWSTLHGYGHITWAAIEGSQYENYYADGTPVSS